MKHNWTDSWWRFRTDLIYLFQLSSFQYLTNTAYDLVAFGKHRMITMSSTCIMHVEKLFILSRPVGMLVIASSWNSNET